MYTLTIFSKLVKFTNLAPKLGLFACTCCGLFEPGMTLCRLCCLSFISTDTHTATHTYTHTHTLKTKIALALKRCRFVQVKRIAGRQEKA